ncbi:MAG: AMP-binding protein [Gammaproteobacteria bacterium]|nr:AMP-binding protein [Gammaproteobacteria bacterium]
MPPQHFPDTIPGLLARRAASRPDEVALREKEFGIWQEITWAEYLRRVRAFALGLAELGAEEGNRVAIIGDNRPEWMIAELAAQAAGILPLGLYQDAIADELARMLEAAEARIVVAEDQEQVDKVLEVRDRLPGLEYIVYYDSRGMYGYEAPGLMSFEEIEALGERAHRRSPDAFDRRLSAVQPADIALLCTTSGTTSIPKLAMLSHENLIAMASQLRSVDAMHRGDEFVSFLPLAWIGEQMVAVASGLLAGFTVNFPEETATARKDMREIGPAFLMSPPRIWENMVSDVQVMAEDTTRLKRWFYGWAMKQGAATAEARFRGRRLDPVRRLAHRLADWTVFHPIRDQLGLSRVRRAYTGGAALLVGHQSAQSVAGYVQHAVRDAKHLARVFALRVFHPGVETVQRLAVKKPDDFRGPHGAAARVAGRRLGRRAANRREDGQTVQQEPVHDAPPSRTQLTARGKSHAGGVTRPWTDWVLPSRFRKAAPRSPRSRAEVARNPSGDGHFFSTAVPILPPSVNTEATA